MEDPLQPVSDGDAMSGDVTSGDATSGDATSGDATSGDATSGNGTVPAAEDASSQPQRDDAPDWLRDPRLKSLDPRHVIVERIGGWISIAVLTGVALVAFTGSMLAGWPSGWWRGLAAAIGLIVFAGHTWYALAWPAIAHRWCRYAADEEGLRIHRGVVWRSVVFVPRSRIQHTDVRQGPLQRRYGLGKLVVYTAGTQHAAIELNGLSREEALALRDLLTAREDEDVPL